MIWLQVLKKKKTKTPALCKQCFSLVPLYLSPHGEDTLNVNRRDSAAANGSCLFTPPHPPGPFGLPAVRQQLDRLCSWVWPRCHWSPGLCSTRGPGCKHGLALGATLASCTLSCWFFGALRPSHFSSDFFFPLLAHLLLTG